MLHKTGTTAENYWFQCRPSFDSDLLTIEWPVTNGAFVIVETAIAFALLSNGWARAMTAAEITEVNDSLTGE